jgi:hypothetical protein
MTNIEPALKAVPIIKLRPTQITVGMREVSERRRRWHERSGKKAGDYLGKHQVPVVLGPNDRLYITDHHHLALALLEEGQKDVLVNPVADLRKLDEGAFWFTMDNRGWTHPFDEHGRRRTFRELPKSVKQLVDDPYRSLAGELRRVGGFAKDTTPFSEFLWADFLRRRIKLKRVAKNFSHAVEQALQLARSNDADYLPGWCGPADGD